MGVLFTTLSAVFLGLTVIIDRFIVADWYKNNARSAWVVSSVVGATLGLIATAVAWFLYDLNVLLDLTDQLMTQHIVIILAIIYCGTLTSLTLRSYFKCFSGGVESTLVAMAIAATPLFVFLTSALAHGQDLTAAHWLSVIAAVSGLVGYQALSSGGDWSAKGKVWPIIAVIALSTAYIVLLDIILGWIVHETTLTELEAALVTLPFYWLGFGLGLVDVMDREVVRSIGHILEQRKRVLLLLLMEIIGMGFYFFEVFGLSGLDAGLVAIIVGAHVVMVWLFDLYLQHRAHHTTGDRIQILRLFTIRRESVQAYSWLVITLQAACIILVLIGVAAWPSK